MRQKVSPCDRLCGALVVLHSRILPAFGFYLRDPRIVLRRSLRPRIGRIHPLIHGFIRMQRTVRPHLNVPFSQEPRARGRSQDGAQKTP